MRFMIVNAYGRSNRGDSVLLDECISEIKDWNENIKISGAVFNEISEISKVHPDIKWSSRIGNCNIKGLYGKFLTLVIILIAILSSFSLLSWLAYLLPKPQRHTFLNIKKSDIVLSAPGGYIHDTNFSFYIALLHLWLGHKFGKKVILAPQSIGPIDGLIARNISKFILKRCFLICARESYSYNFLKHDLHLMDDVLIRQTGDSAFWNFQVSEDNKVILDAFNEIGIKNNNNILGVTVVDWNFPKSKDLSKSTENYINNMAYIIDYISENYNLTPVIFNQVSEDLIMARKVAKVCKTNVLIDSISREPDILRAMISHSKVFLGTRFHSCIFSMMAGRPTYAIAYLPKTSFILEDLNLSHRHINIDDIVASKVISQIEKDLDDISAAENEIKNAVNTYRNKYLRMSDLLLEYLN